MVDRVPASDGPPGCYAVYRGDSSCEACPWEKSCRAASAAARARLTAQEACNRAVAAHRDAVMSAEVTPAEVVAACAAEFQARGGNVFAAAKWTGSREWLAVAAFVIRVCRASGWDPRTYAAAQATAMTWFCVEKGFRFGPGMLVGEKAAVRFRRWMERNARANGDAATDHARDPGYESMVAGECAFAARYMRFGCSVADAEAYARVTYPEWSLAASRGVPHLRLPGLVTALSVVEPSLPHRVLVPADDPVSWRWRDVRGLVSTVYSRAAAEDEPVIDLDPSLGTFL